MSKRLTEKTSYNCSMEIWQKRVLDELSRQKGIPVNEILLTGIMRIYPNEFNAGKQRNVRRVIAP